MRIKSLISLAAIACLLMVAISPLTARNTPYPENTRDNTAHPWQDDNQWVDPLDNARINIPFGPIIISIDIPADWLNALSTKTTNQTDSTTKSVKTARPMSFNKKGDIR